MPARSSHQTARAGSFFGREGKEGQAEGVRAAVERACGFGKMEEWRSGRYNQRRGIISEKYFTKACTAADVYFRSGSRM